MFQPLSGLYDLCYLLPWNMNKQIERKNASHTLYPSQKYGKNKPSVSMSEHELNLGQRIQGYS